MASGAASIAAAIASKTKTKKKHFMPQKKKLFRSSDPLLSVLMWGVNHSVSLNKAQICVLETNSYLKHVSVHHRLLIDLPLVVIPAPSCHVNMIVCNDRRFTDILCISDM
ncbi:phosphatidylinositol 5-phosphate 4-kinase type-2 alpha isoform X1 [Tachysurus ichikawai]